MFAASDREQIPKHCSLEPRGDFKAVEILMVPPQLLGGWLMSEYGEKNKRVWQKFGPRIAAQLIS
ncbi:hypothetical protein [Bradyrhizobium diazoefficiens]|uniref:hypothetical protein n=1 Tax=Bradyrhizobium diazoefficiens TaxID=1355477 RepID=UPI00272C53E8|nr:hypothetical protein [Bradyrhizobium diazoefficiens]WLA67657.1 hypothetical protein QNN01_13830 [Bradyrhizobium diazoefficiens]